MLQGQGCSYFRGARNINHVELFSKHRLPAVFDIEDLLDTGKRNGVSRSMCDCVVCPFERRFSYFGRVRLDFEQVVDCYEQHPPEFLDKRSNR